MALEIKTSIIIDANAQSVWKEFTKFDSYKNWNPFIKSITGEVQVGNSIKAEIDGMTFKPEILIFDKNHKLEWLGHLMFSGIFDGQHSFELISNQDGTTTFVQSEKFSGILVPLFKKKLLSDTQAGFHSMNIALKERVECNLIN